MKKFETMKERWFNNKILFIGINYIPVGEKVGFNKQKAIWQSKDIVTDIWIIFRHDSQTHELTDRHFGGYLHDI